MTLPEFIHELNERTHDFDSLHPMNDESRSCHVLVQAPDGHRYLTQGITYDEDKHQLIITTV